MLKRSRDTAEYYMAELSRYVLEANDVNDVYFAQKKQVRDAMTRVTQLSYLHA